VADFIINFFTSMRHGEIAGNDPWDAQTLEWTVSSPPPAYNLLRSPSCPAAPPLGIKNIPRREASRKPLVAVEQYTGEHLSEGFLLPITVALGLFIASYGLIYSFWVVIPGIAVVFYGIIGWFREHF